MTEDPRPADETEPVPGNGSDSTDSDDAAGPGTAAQRRGRARRRRLRMTVLGRVRAYFLAGILVTAPISITFYLAWIFIAFVDRNVAKLIPAAYNPNTYLPFGIPGLGVVIMLAFLTLVGAMTAGFLGRMLIRFYESMLARMPVVRSVYGAIKQIIETVLAQKSNAFREAVLVEYPRRGIWAIGFLTGRTEGEVQNLTDEEMINVFLPTTPNPTSGFLLFVSRRDLVPLTMPVEDAIKMVISGGIVTPPDTRPAAERKKPKIEVARHEAVEILRERDGTPILVTRSGSEPGDRS